MGIYGNISISEPLLFNTTIGNNIIPLCCIEYRIHNVQCDQPAFLMYISSIHMCIYIYDICYVCTTSYNRRLFSTIKSSKSSFESLPTSQRHFLHHPKLELRRDPRSRAPRHAYNVNKSSQRHNVGHKNQS